MQEKMQKSEHIEIMLQKSEHIEIMLLIRIFRCISC